MVGDDSQNLGGRRPTETPLTSGLIPVYNPSEIEVEMFPTKPTSSLEFSHMAARWTSVTLIDDVIVGDK